jgi:uncharacterized protein YodC (DUF2158 family)
MTVGVMESNGLGGVARTFVQCKWFEGATLHTDKFTSNSLELSDPVKESHEQENS